MFEQDYIMRQIKEMTAVMAKVLFGAKTDQSFYMLQEVERQKAFALIEKMHNGEIKDAVCDVNRLADKQSKENLMIGLEFYSDLCDMSDDFFSENGYSFVNAKKDFRQFAEKFGMQQMTELYFGSENNNE